LAQCNHFDTSSARADTSISVQRSIIRDGAPLLSVKPTALLQAAERLAPRMAIVRP